MDASARERLLLLVVGPPAEAAGLTRHLTDPSVDVRVCADAAEAVRILQARQPEQPLRAGALCLHPSALSAELHGRRIALPPREFRLLHLLTTHAGQVVTRECIREAVWPSHGLDASNTITVHVRRLRARLGGERRHPTIIQTVRRLGYRLVPPVEKTVS